MCHFYLPLIQLNVRKFSLEKESTMFVGFNGRFYFLGCHHDGDDDGCKKQIIHHH